MKLKSLKSLKSNSQGKFGCYYKCMGVLTRPDLENVVKDTFDYLINEKYLNIPCEDICIKINSKDTDLIEAINGVDIRIAREIDKLSIDHYTHKYGMTKENITGRDFNIGIRKKGTNEYLSCAAFVIMENDNKKIAIDMGISNSSLSMCKFGTHSTIASSRMADIVPINTIEKEKFSDALMGVSILLKEDIMHHPSKNFRRKFRLFVYALKYRNEILYKYSDEDLARLVIKYLNIEYHSSFESYEKKYAQILALYKGK